MKKLFLCISLLASFFSIALADEATEQDLKKIKCKIIIQASQPEELRKVSPDVILNGIANSCINLSKITGKHDKSEKQIATCNFIISCLQLISEIFKKKHKKPKNNNSEKPMNQKKSVLQEYNDEQNISTDDKKRLTNETILLTLGLISISNDDNANESLKSNPSVYFSMLKNLPDDKSRCEVIKQILNDEKEASAFLEDLAISLGKVIFVSIPEITTNLLESLKDIFKSEVK